MRGVRIFPALLLPLAVAACGGGGGGGGVSGQINGDGSSTVFPITEAVAEEFKRENPDVEVNVGISGTGGGFEKFCNGETDLQNASRPISQEEEEACGAKGVEYVELTIANDGLALVVNKQNDWVKCITTRELRKIWQPDSNVKTWSDVRAGFPNVSMKLYGPGTDSGTVDYFTEEINGESGASRTDYTPSENDNTIVQGVAGDRGSLGYFGFAYFSENEDKLKLLALDGGKGCVEPSDETVRDTTYPLSRPLFLYVRKAAAQRPAVKEFIDFYFDTVSELVADVGYTAVDEQTLQKERAEWQQLAGT